MTDRKLENYIGLCRAAGGITTGFDLVLGEVRRKKAVFVLIADDASDRTAKQISDKCEFYEVPYFPAGMTADELAHLIGKRSACAAAAFTGRGPCRPLLSLFEERARESMNENENQKKNENAAMTERMIVDGSKTDNSI
ncbi:MAG: ribosomal L7Ae/L30e/S12e/Gadd45 family protein [Clostridia bacterium]|nr:hypothetical protein [Oscillospiraceae bacterium]MBO5128266.1 ribosomal L7Ae/L30e/S12e/Gadd45 family protein [Clostridia bacterium]MBO5258137.1 ribosomal L7Ae/L30e/S12e/Gadd45 family protein [Clostridia bacterium]MBP3292659.1 ribosomal L7Ae/L30e/S12e/Gadd45 family protein [Clostridia bacterium]MBQ7312351.1 ribosomal L7Ae/L30e/S12e/Gadd45 family protein [Clostridia bacterium]